MSNILVNELQIYNARLKIKKNDPLDDVLNKLDDLKTILNLPPIIKISRSVYLYTNLYELVDDQNFKINFDLFCRSDYFDELFNDDYTSKKLFYKTIIKIREKIMNYLNRKFNNIRFDSFFFVNEG